MKHWSWLFCAATLFLLSCGESADCPEAVAEQGASGMFEVTSGVNAVTAAGPVVTFTGGPTSGAAPLKVFLDGTTSKPQAGDGSWISACKITYGDGASTTNCYGEHTYTAGSYTATFTATDNLGRSNSAQVAITSGSGGGGTDAGTPDAGPPPPATTLRWYTTANGLPWARNASVDEAGNIWAVNDLGLYVKRPGDANFSKKPSVGQFTRGDWAYTVCGGAPNVAYVGYVTPSTDPLGGTADQRTRGDLDRLAISPSSGAVSLQYHYPIVNTNDPQYNEVQTIVSCSRQNKKSSTDYGSLYLGSNHAVTRIQGDKYADHRHVVFSKPSGTLVIGYNWATALAPNGNLFFANEYKIGELKPTPVLNDWISFSANPWVVDTYVPPAGTLEDADAWHAAAVTPDGKHWVGSWTKGLFWMTISPRGYTAITNEPEQRINALAAQADNSIWVGTQNQGLWKRSASGTWTKLALPGSPGLIYGLYLDDRTTPRTLYISTDKGLGVYTGP